MATITVKINDSFVKLNVENDEYRFVEGTEGNMVISANGEVLKRYPKSYRYGGRKSYYEVVHPKQNVAGYLQINVPIRNTTTLVHRLVAETFLSNPKGYNEIDHRNHNRLDNRAENLRWCTHSENMSNSNKPEAKIFWKDITAEDISSGEIYEFSRFRDIVPFSLSRGWGNGWGTAIRRKLEQSGGTAYGFYWSARVKETVNIG